MRTFVISMMAASCCLVLLPPEAAAAQPEPKAATDPSEAGSRYYERGVAYARKGRLSKALEYFEKALPHVQSSSDLYYNLVSVAVALKDWRRLLLYSQGFIFLEGSSDDAKAVVSRLEYAKSQLRSAGAAPVAVAFHVQPKGVEIRVDRVPIARSGGRPVWLVPGKHTARAERPDWHPWEQEIEVPARSEGITVSGEMKRMIYYGFLSVETQPADGVQIFADDELVGTTPLEEPIKLETRRYLIRFEKPGFDKWIRYVDIKRDETHDLRPKMEPEGTPW